MDKPFLILTSLLLFAAGCSGGANRTSSGPDGSPVSEASKSQDPADSGPSTGDGSSGGEASPEIVMEVIKTVLN